VVSCSPFPPRFLSPSTPLASRLERSLVSSSARKLAFESFDLLRQWSSWWPVQLVEVISPSVAVPFSCASFGLYLLFELDSLRLNLYLLFFFVYRSTSIRLLHGPRSFLVRLIWLVYLSCLCLPGACLIKCLPADSYFVLFFYLSGTTRIDRLSVASWEGCLVPLWPARTCENNAVKDTCQCRNVV
jgi:hypothetical protein